MTKTIAIVGTLDTKGDEVKYLKELIEARGHKVLLIDPGVLGEVPFAPDIDRHRIAEAAGMSLSDVIALGDEGEATKVMARGTALLAQELYSNGQFDGIIALGGSMGTSLGMAVMKVLPLVIPKLMVSTVAFLPVLHPQEVSKDLTVMPTVADIWGLNRVTKRVLENAAGAISGMVETYKKEEVSEKPFVGVTTLGSSALKYAPLVKQLLEEREYEVAVFHSNGVGGHAFEQFVEQGLLDAALDLSLFELINYMCGSNAGVDRLEAIAKRAIPQVVAPGALNFVSWYGPPETLPAQFRERTLHMHNPVTTQIKTSPEEMAAVAELMARKLNKAKGPTVVLVPTRGLCSMDKPGGVFYDPEGDKAFIEVLRRDLEPRIRLVELDVHIDDPLFAQEAVAILDGLMGEQIER